MEETRYDRLRMQVIAFTVPDIITTSGIDDGSETWSGDNGGYSDNGTSFNNP